LSALAPAPAADEFRRKNRSLYDRTSGAVWDTVVYGDLHGGHEFINLGGAAIVDRVAAALRLGPESDAVEFCSGRGAVCRYLAERYGCRVLGIEWNARQIAAARDLKRRTPAAAASRIGFRRGDCVAWRPRRAVDAVLSIDSFMLLPSAAAALRSAWRGLVPGGRLAVVTLAAGRKIDHETRRFVWDEDGMASLHSAREYRRMLAAAEFENAAIRDESGRAIAAMARMDRALRLRQSAAKAADAVAFAGWIAVGEAYLEAFRCERLAYLLLTAEKPRKGRKPR
jgi:SAM-dependent methyltransferase